MKKNILIVTVSIVIAMLIGCTDSRQAEEDRQRAKAEKALQDYYKRQYDGRNDGYDVPKRETP